VPRYKLHSGVHDSTYVGDARTAFPVLHSGQQEGRWLAGISMVMIWEKAVTHVGIPGTHRRIVDMFVGLCRL